LPLERRGRRMVEFVTRPATSSRLGAAARSFGCGARDGGAWDERK